MSELSQVGIVNIFMCIDNKKRGYNVWLALGEFTLAKSIDLGPVVLVSPPTLHKGPYAHAHISTIQ